MLNNYFSKCFTTSLPPLYGSFESAVQRRRLYKCFLRSIDVSKASGPDQFSGRMLKFTAASIAAPVTKLFNQSISTGCFPVTWKWSNIVPIPKSGDKASLTNYTPVSLLPILGKPLERHIVNLLFVTASDGDVTNL